MAERAPLLHYRLSSGVHEDSGEHRVREAAAGRRRSGHNHPQKLSTFFGVVIPTLLSMFSVVVFLRI
ncbi:solute carrier family 12 member 9, partial [Tachysurus ichikawai]